MEQKHFDMITGYAPMLTRRLRRIALLLLLAAAWLPAASDEPPPERLWTVDGEDVSATYESMLDQTVHLLRGGERVSFPFDRFSEKDRRAIVDAEDTDLPARSPAWMSGYAIRYRLRVMEDPLRLAARRTVIAGIPTGGWLKPDASDLRVVTLSGKVLPVAVLSHDPQGDTLLQFEREGMDRWYWVYAVNRKAPPQVDQTVLQRMAQARVEAREAELKTMELRRASAEAAGELRDVEQRIERARATLGRVENELKQLATHIPERRVETARAEEAVAPLEARVTGAEEAKASADAAAAAMLARVREAERLAAEAESAAAAAAAAHTAAARRAAAVFDEMEKMRMINEAQAVMLATRQVADTRKAQVAVAEEAALPSRMAAAGAETELAAARKAFADARQQVGRLKQAVDKAVAQQAEAEKQKAALQAELNALAPRVKPLADAVAVASAKASELAEVAARLEAGLKELSLASDPRAHREGFSVEVRDWSGDRLDELSKWSVVVEGLMRSDNVLGNAAITDVLQKMNPFRLGNTLNFAASYRGFLKIEKGGLYRFFLNADEAAFLFINDYLVFSRVGSNRPVEGRLNVFGVGEDIELDAGVYRLEIHQVTGNTPGAVGRCAFYWITPGAKAWSRVPPGAFAPALAAMTTAVEAHDGRPVAIPRCGVANTMTTGGFRLHLTRFEAAGAPPGAAVQWDFGDGLAGANASMEHVYFGDGDYLIRLKSHPGLPPFQRRFHVWSAPVDPGPLALGDAVRVMEDYDLDRLDAARLGTVFAFLSICGQPSRWRLMERVSGRLLKQPGLDLQYRIGLYTARMEALARLGRTADAVELAAEALRAAGPLRSLTIEVQLKLADIHRLHLRDFDEAGRGYARIVEENRRLSFESVRRAAVAWGDMHVEMGDTSRAAEIYRLAAGLGRAEGAQGAATEATTRGALLRVAEQQLRAGNIRHTRQLLERIEQEYPEQKVEGLYRFLRAEADRHAGRYLEAIRNYEILLRLQQWAGYRAAAMHGLADSYYRLEQFEDALRWTDAILDAFPAFYEQRGLSAFRAVVAASRDAGEESRRAFAGLDAGFDAGEPPPAGMRYRLMPLPGMTPRSLMLTQPTDQSSQHYQIELRNIVSEGAYWVEFWYRNEFVHSHAVVNPSVRLEFAGDGGSRGTSRTVPVIRTFGQTFMAGALLRAPVTRDGRIRLVFDSFQGLQQIQGLRVRPVGAVEQEALLNFTEGVDTP